MNSIKKIIVSITNVTNQLDSLMYELKIFLKTFKNPSN